MQKIAADLGERNIPRNLIDMVAPEAVQVLYWREEASNPEDTTVELWMTQTSSFIVMAGLYTGSWDSTNIYFLTESQGYEFNSLESGLAAIKRNFTFGQIEEPHEQTTALNKVKRLIRKSN